MSRIVLVLQHFEAAALAPLRAARPVRVLTEEGVNI